jgi:hypothetical protein
MRNPSSFYQKALRGFVTAAWLSALSLSAVDIPGTAKVSGPIAQPDGHLKGEYWQRPPVSIQTGGRTDPAQRIDVQINAFGPPTGTFNATRFSYTGNDLSAVPAYLLEDAASFVGTPGNLDDGALRFRGFINVATAGIINMGVTSDDGSRITIAGIDIAERDGSHGDETQDMDANFLEAGLYPIEITYFNGDWTDPAAAGCSSDHDPSPTCTAHGGANFHLRIGGATISAAQVQSLFQSELPEALPNLAQIGGNKIGSVSPLGDGNYDFVAGGNDIWSDRDEHTFAYTEVTGDFDVQVNVESVAPNARWSKAGIMVRETLSEHSRMLFPRRTPLAVPTMNGGDGANDTRFSYRTGIDNVAGANGGEHEDCLDCENQRPSNGHTWLRLQRAGNVFTAYSGTDGMTWSELGTQDTATWGGGPLPATLYVGLGAGRHSGGPTADVAFRSFAFNYDVAADFNVTGADSRGNPTGIRVSFDKPLGNGAFSAGSYTLSTVSGPNVTVVQGLRLTTANDAPARDPMTFTLEGAYTADGPWTLIASGNTGLDTARFTTAPDILFANETGYSHYRLLFPTVRDAAAANSMQIGEVEFLDSLGVDITEPTDTVVGVVAVAGNDYSQVAVVGTAGGVNNYPAAEHPGLTIDGPNTTKYLNFAELNTGIIVSPAGGTPPVASVLSASAGPGNTVNLTTTPLVEGAEYMIDVNGGPHRVCDLSALRKQWTF